MTKVTTNEYDQDGERADGLPPELVDAAAVEQPVDTRGGGGRREQADGEGAPETADEVDADDVERVVVAEAGTSGRPRGRRPRRRARPTAIAPERADRASRPG